MATYFSTFISGLGEIVKFALKKELPDVKIDKILDGLVVYKTSAKLEKIKSLRFFNNSFILFNFTDKPIDFLIDQVVRDLSLKAKLSGYLPNKRISFRIVTLLENKSAKFSSKKLELLEKKITGPNLFINRSSPHVEFLLLTRREGGSFFGLRLTRPDKDSKSLFPGQIRYELASLLCYASDPKPDDMFLDPFSGYGSIPLERAHLPYKKIIAGEMAVILTADREFAANYLQVLPQFKLEASYNVLVSGRKAAIFKVRKI